MLAAALLALTAAAHHPHAAKSPCTVRAVIVSGNGQVEHAYVAVGAPAYITIFPGRIAVRFIGPEPRKGSRHVRFTCVTKGCTFASAEQGDDAEFVNRVKNGKVASANEYEARAQDDGVAAVHLAVQSETPAGTYLVRAEPVVNAGERAVPVFFRLTTH